MGVCADEESLYRWRYDGRWKNDGLSDHEKQAVPFRFPRRRLVLGHASVSSNGGDEADGGGEHMLSPEQLSQVLGL